MNNKITQQERILRLLRERGDIGVYVYELTTPRPNGLGVSQYNARILELREQLKKKGTALSMLSQDILF